MHSRLVCDSDEQKVRYFLCFRNSAFANILHRSHLNQTLHFQGNAPQLVETRTFPIARGQQHGVDLIFIFVRACSSKLVP